jgi:pimeloyl-ACP methyl ester carboxylesterase
MVEITEHMATSPRHASFYLAAGPKAGPTIIFVHGWPELSSSWRHQLPAMAALGFRAIAPDMRGYGRSQVYSRHEDYALREIVADMLELADALGVDQAVWVGHDWGSPVVWSLASHHPERCLAVANLCVPYRTIELGLDAILPLIDRQVYPEAEFPVGQWDYMRFYEENFDKARRAFDANPYNTAKALFRKGDPNGRGKPARTALVRKRGGWFGDGAPAPDVPRDADVLSEAELCAYAAALERNGFFGPDSWYMNHAANAAYAGEAANGGRLDMPALFLAARWDYTCECIDSRLAEPMRGYIRDLTEGIVDSGHWMAQEKPVAVNAALVHWLATRVPGGWPR